ncbi:MAG: phosphoglucosamine mutase [archaeon]
MFGTNGIRGIANVDLTPQLVLKMSQAVGTFFNGGRMLIGRDGRTSGKMVSLILQSGLMSTGCLVHDAGLAPTPCIQYTIRSRNYDGGVVVTASHNPPQYNGLKVIDRDGIEVSRENERKIEEIFFKDKLALRDWNKLGRVEAIGDILSPYRKAVETHIETEPIRERAIQVVVDAGNGVGALVTPQLLREMGCEVQTINSDVDGMFPGRPPEPTPDNLKGLSRVVQATGADLGIAHDGDADRVIFVAENGEVQWGDRTFALLAKRFLMRHRGETIVTPVSSSQVIRDIADSQGGKVVWTRVGSIDVSRKMQEIGAKLGGEENGGVFYGPHVPVRDGAMTAAMMVEALALTGEKLSRLIGELPHYYNIKARIPCPDNMKSRVLSDITQRSSNMTVETIDGLKVWLDEHTWILIRPSGTEPIFRMFVEASLESEAEKLLSEYTAILQSLIKGE